MNNVSLRLPSSKKEIEVSVDKKDMKTCRLKVYPNGMVRMSVPKTVSEKWITDFLNQKAQWIENKLDLFSSTVGYAATNEIRNGFSIKMFGEDLIFSVLESSKNKVYREGKTIFISTKNPNDPNQIMKQFDSWWRD